MKVQFPDILRPFFGKITWRKNSSSKVLYLTFDDGPVPEATPFVLEILAKQNIKATFFCVGENVKNYPEIYTEIQNQKHRTGNHTYNHLKGTSISTNEYIENVKQAADFIQSNLFRPPYGRMTYRQKCILRKEYEIIMWDVLTCDYDRSLSVEHIFDNIKRFTRNGSIIVFHDSIKSKNNLLNVLPIAIDWWRKQGYEFGIL